ncbi:MAG: hypothetical protein QG650_683 [Patescibacteria group bacterium]|nr:hypothetical protein [Patescibacteria group bacterium]
MRESASGVDLEISVNLDAFFKELENVELNDEEFDDLAVQVLLHEVMHAISSNKYLTTPGEREARAKWLAFVEGLSDSDVDPAWESLISRFGYSCNFASPAISLDEMQISTLPLVNSFNEGLTDILAAKAYAHYFRSRGESQERKYSVSYAGEAKALHMALREYAQVKNRPFREVMREVEEGYFFGDSEFLRTFEEIVWPSLTAFQEYTS